LLEKGPQLIYKTDELKARLDSYRRIHRPRAILKEILSRGSLDSVPFKCLPDRLNKVDSSYQILHRLNKKQKAHSLAMKRHLENSMSFEDVLEGGKLFLIDPRNSQGADQGPELKVESLPLIKS